MDASKTFTYFIKAQTGDLERGFQKSGTEAQRLSGKLDKLGRSELDVREATIKVERAQRAATRAAERYGKESLEAASAQVRLERAQERAARSAHAGAAKVDKQGRALRGLTAASKGAVVGIGVYGVAGAIRSVVTASIEAEKSQAKLDAQLKAVGKSSDTVRAQIDRVVQAQSLMSGFDDEALTDSFTNIVRTTGNVTRSLELNNLAMDLAGAKNMDVAKAGEIVAKVAGGNTGVLSRYGFSLKKGATASDALALLQGKLAGQAERYGKTQAGSIERMNTAWENLREKLGNQLAPMVTKAADSVSKFVTQMQDGTGTGGKFLDTVKQIASPIGKIARSAGEFVKNNPEIAKAAASFAIIGGAASKLSKLTGAGGLIKFAFGRGNTPVTPMYVKDVGGPGPRSGPSFLPAVVKVAIAQIAAGVVLPVAALKAGGFLNTAKDKAPGSIADQYGIDRQPGTSRLVDKIPGVRQVSETLNAVGGGTGKEQIQRFGETLNNLKGSLASLNPAKLRELRQEAQRLTNAFPSKVPPGLRKLMQDIDAQLGGTTRKISHSWDALQRNTSMSLGDINANVRKNMSRVRRAMQADSQAGASALRANIGGAVGSVELAMRRGAVSVETGMARINQLLSSELKQLGVTYLAADGKSPSIAAGALPKPTIKKQGSTGVIAPGAEIGGARMDGPRSSAASSGGGGGGGRFAARGPAAKLRDWLANKGFSTTSEGRSDSDTFHGMGLALDYGTSSNDLNALSKVLWPARRQFEELFIPTWAPHGGLYHNGNKFTNSSLQAGHQDHIHVAESSKFTPPEIKIPRVYMRKGLGALTPIGQAALDKSRKAAVRYGNRLIEAGGASRYDAPPYRSKYGIKDLVRLALYGGFRGNAAATAAAVAMAESSGETKQASTQGNSPPSTDRGLWQINSYWNKNISDERAYSPTKAARAAFSIYKSRGWKDWVVYNTGAYKQFLPAAQAALKDAPKTTAKKKTAKAGAGGESRADRLRRHYGWDAQQARRASFYESAYTTAVARGDWATVRMTVRGALKFWRGVLSRAVAAGDGEAITNAQAQVDDWKSRPVAQTTGESPFQARDDQVGTDYTLATLTPGTEDDVATATAGRDYWNTRIRQYQYGLKHGDSRVTGSMLSEAIGNRDTYQGYLDGGNSPTDSAANLAAALAENTAAMNANREHAKVILSTTGGSVITGLIAAMASTGIGSSFNLANQTAGRGAGAYASY